MTTATARPRPTARPRGSNPPGAYYQCYVDAGGGTPAYDADRYMALLRDRGVLAPRRGLVEVVDAVMSRAAGAVTGAALAPLLVDELGKDGYRIHDVALCVRPGDPAGVGRPMSPAEEEQLLLPATEPAPTARPRAVGPTVEHITPEGDRFLVPEDWVPGEGSSRCRSCQALILWATTPRGKRAPVNPDGTSHFSDCPQSAQWRKKP